MNFILRTISSDKAKVRFNKHLGNDYSISSIFGKQTEDWKNEIKEHYPLIDKTCDDITDIVSMVICEHETILIRKNTLAYIMTDSGVTFEKILTI